MSKFKDHMLTLVQSLKPLEVNGKPFTVTSDMSEKDITAAVKEINTHPGTLFAIDGKLTTNMFFMFVDGEEAFKIQLGNPAYAYDMEDVPDFITTHKGEASLDKTIEALYKHLLDAKDYVVTAPDGNEIGVKKLTLKGKIGFELSGEQLEDYYITRPSFIIEGDTLIVGLTDDSYADWDAIIDPYWLKVMKTIIADGYPQLKRIILATDSGRVKENLSAQDKSNIARILHYRYESFNSLVEQLIKPIFNLEVFVGSAMDNPLFTLTEFDDHIAAPYNKPMEDSK